MRFLSTACQGPGVPSHSAYSQEHARAPGGCRPPDTLSSGCSSPIWGFIYGKTVWEGEGERSTVWEGEGERSTVWEGEKVCLARARARGERKTVWEGEGERSTVWEGEGERSTVWEGEKVCLARARARGERKTVWEGGGERSACCFLCFLKIVELWMLLVTLHNM